MTGSEEFRATPRLDNRITLQKLEVLCLVVRLGTVTRAAERLFVAQPVVTAHLRSLEERLGVRLFERKGRTLELTDMGERVHRWAQATLDRGQRMVEDVRRLRAGELGLVRLGASMSVGSYRLPAILTEFGRDRPGAQISLFTSDPETAMRAVEQEELDFCVVVLDELPSSAALEAEILGAEDFVLVTGPDGPLAERALTVEDLQSLPMVGAPSGSIQRSLLDKALARHNAPPHRSVIELGHPEAIKAAVLDRAGAAMLFRSSVEAELAEGVLREVPLRDATLRVPVCVVKRRGRRLSELQRRLLDRIGESLSGGEGTVRAGASVGTEAQWSDPSTAN